MDDLPENWIDKLFDCMSIFYSERWTKNLTNPVVIDLYKMMWSNSLRELSYAEIKHGLAGCKNKSKIKYSLPPNNIQFFHLCKKIDYPRCST